MGDFRIIFKNEHVVLLEEEQSFPKLLFQESLAVKMRRKGKSS